MGTEKPDQELRKAILAKLWRRGVFGGRYIPVEKALSKIPRHEWDRARENIDQMHKNGLIEFHKGKDCISINPSNKDEVKKVLKGYFPDYVLDMR